MNKNNFNKITIKIIPKEIIKKYYFSTKKIGGFIYFRLEKVMYSLVQARIISHDALKENILPYGYVPAQITQGL